MSEDKVRVVQAGEPTADPELPSEVAVLPLRDTVLFPNLALPVLVGKERSLKLIEDVVDGDRILATTAVRPDDSDHGDEEVLDPARVFQSGTLGRVAELMRLPTGGIQIAVQGMARVRFVEWVRTEPYLVARIEPVTESSDVEAEARMRAVLGVFRRVAEIAPYIPPQFAVAAMNIHDPGDLADFLAANLNMPLADKQELIEEADAAKRLIAVEKMLSHELSLLELSTQTQRELSEDVQKLQREQFLRRQLDVIRRQLGEGESGSDLEELRERVESTEMPEEARKAAERELGRLERMQRGSPEETVARTYLDWLIEVPWRRPPDEDHDLDRARKILEADHYGLEDVKERILEYLAVGALRPDNRSPILCFVGPPGVGKTSLGQSIARAMRRQFVRMSLGGIRDEAEIRGHRRTYIGALPGRIIQGLRRAGTSNPVMMLDEIDKLGMDYRGDPSSALLEVLDPQQNDSFVDHYLEVPYDLSRTLFICTANMMDPIPGPLRDRMEVIELRGYTEPEKLEIAKRHLIPRQLDEHGLKAKQAAIAPDALKRIVREYTYEAGVRNLERQIAAVLRKVALRIAQGESKKVTVRASTLDDMLGPPRVRSEPLGDRDELGVATGLAWTPGGGDILSIEAVMVRGSSAFTLTGHLGDVMKESARAALTYARTRAQSLGVDERWFEEHEIHVHVPAGAIPKDGPSAGIAMATAIVSAIARVNVKRKVGLTGEITLRGKVLPVGGIKEKVIAAHRVGVKTVILPAANERDLADVPEFVRTQLRFVLVDHMDEVLQEALTKSLPRLSAAKVVSPAGSPELRERASARQR